MSTQSEAKPNSISCMNHLKHGGTSETLFLANEDPKEFFALLESAFAQYQPAFHQDAVLVTRSVRANWILMRRERTADAFEAALHTRKPDPTYWVPTDLHEVNLFDRYKTAAARAYTRSLKDLQTIKKMAHDERRWTLQLESQKQELATDVARFNLLKQKEAAKAPPPAPPPAPQEDIDLPAAPPVQSAGIQQTLYIGRENGVNIIYEVTPSNDNIRLALSESDQVVRTYNFVGCVPAEYQHLITPDAITWGKSTSVQKILSFDEWNQLAATE